MNVRRAVERLIDMRFDVPACGRVHCRYAVYTWHDRACRGSWRGYGTR